MTRAFYRWPLVGTLALLTGVSLTALANAQSTTGTTKTKTAKPKSKPKKASSAKTTTKAKTRKAASKATSASRKTARKKTARTSPCQGLTRSACSGKSSCLWVQAKKRVDKNGRKLSSYCRKRAARTAKVRTN